MTLLRTLITLDFTMSYLYQDLRWVYTVSVLWRKVLVIMIYLDSNKVKQTSHQTLNKIFCITLKTADQINNLTLITTPNLNTELNTWVEFETKISTLK